jgi:uncharacterized protein DUF5329
MKFLLCFVAIEVTLTTFPALAAMSEQDAIGHLIRFVETSSCTFIRNGSEYDSRDAVDHIKRKYSYFQRKIHTAEDFIALAATKSEFSGKPYVVRCGKRDEMPTADWLGAELRNFRSIENKN